MGVSAGCLHPSTTTMFFNALSANITVDHVLILRYEHLIKLSPS